MEPIPEWTLCRVEVNFAAVESGYRVVIVAIDCAVRVGIP